MCFNGLGVRKCVLCSKDVGLVWPYSSKCSAATINGPCTTTSGNKHTVFLKALCGSCSYSIEAKKESDEELKRAKTATAFAVEDMMREQNAIHEAILILNRLSVARSKAESNVLQAHDLARVLELDVTTTQGTLRRLNEAFKELEEVARLAKERHEHAEGVLEGRVARRDNAGDCVRYRLSVLAEVRADRVKRGYEA